MSVYDDACRCSCGVMLYQRYDPARRVTTVQHGENPEHVRVITDREAVSADKVCVIIGPLHAEAEEHQLLTGVGLIGRWVAEVHAYERRDRGQL